MIYDTLEKLEEYRGMLPNLDTLIDWLKQNGLSTLPLGKTVIDGENLFVNVMECETLPAEGRYFETHSRYLDLQTDIEGTEICEVTVGPVREHKPYDEEADCALYEGETTAAVVLGETRFALFLTEEPHRPTVRAAGCDRVKKAVFKIAY